MLLYYIGAREKQSHVSFYHVSIPTSISNYSKSWAGIMLWRVHKVLENLYPPLKVIQLYRYLLFNSQFWICLQRYIRLVLMFRWSYSIGLFRWCNGFFVEFVLYWIELCFRPLNNYCYIHNNNSWYWLN